MQERLGTFLQSARRRMRTEAPPTYNCYLQPNVSVWGIPWSHNLRITLILRFHLWFLADVHRVLPKIDPLDGSSQTPLR